MENLRVVNGGMFENIVSRSTNPRVVNILEDIKGIAFVVELNAGFPETSVYYRFEDGLSLTLDNRVPKHQELYRDVVYHRIDRILDWNVSAPVVPWRLDGSTKGTIRPFWKKIEVKEEYQFKKEIVKNKDFWIKAAVLDYICAVTDRFANDVLFVDTEPVLTDSGLSFVDGTEFVSQKSLIREILKGEEVPEEFLSDIRGLNLDRISKQTQGLIDLNAVNWVLERAARVSQEGVVI